MWSFFTGLYFHPLQLSSPGVGMLVTAAATSSLWPRYVNQKKKKKTHLPFGGCHSHAGQMITKLRERECVRERRAGRDWNLMMEDRFHRCRVNLLQRFMTKKPQSENVHKHKGRNPLLTIPHPSTTGQLLCGMRRKQALQHTQGISTEREYTF